MTSSHAHLKRHLCAILLMPAHRPLCRLAALNFTSLLFYPIVAWPRCCSHPPTTFLSDRQSLRTSAPYPPPNLLRYHTPIPKHDILEPHSRKSLVVPPHITFSDLPHPSLHSPPLPTLSPSTTHPLLLQKKHLLPHNGVVFQHREWPRRARANHGSKVTGQGHGKETYRYRAGFACVKLLGREGVRGEWGVS